MFKSMEVTDTSTTTSESMTTLTTYERIHCNDHPISIFVYGDSGNNSKHFSYVHYNQNMQYSSQNTQLGTLNSLRLKQS